jgi:hypothetical protein
MQKARNNFLAFKILIAKFCLHTRVLLDEKLSTPAGAFTYNLYSEIMKDQRPISQV